MSSGFFTQKDAMRLIDLIEARADELAIATDDECKLEDQRPLVKDAAIKRLVESGVATSVTAAEKVVERDERYTEHRAMQRIAVARRIVARGRYDAARLRAELAVQLAGAEFDDALTFGRGPAAAPGGSPS